MSAAPLLVPAARAGSPAVRQLPTTAVLAVAVAACVLGTALWASPMVLATQSAASSVTPTAQHRVAPMNVVLSEVPEVPPTVLNQLQVAEETSQGDMDSARGLDISELESQLEQIGSTVSTLSTAAFPLFGAVLALFAGLLARKALPHSASESRETLRPMDMAATEEMPLTRRGMLATLGLLPMVAATPAFAARSGGRVGGSSFRSFRAAPPPSVGRGAVGGMAGAAGGGGTVVFARPPVIVAPPPVIVAPSPFGFGPFSPFGFGLSTGEFMALSAIELTQSFIREQQRQQYIQQQLEIQRNLGRDQAQIEALQQQLAAQELRMRELQQAMSQKGVAAPAQ